MALMSITVQAQQGQWTWMNGSNLTNQSGHFGTQGVFDSANTPPSLWEACQWTDKDGNFWLFGGLEQSGWLYSDLWEFKPSINQWAWIKGTGIINQQPLYGTYQIPSTTNSPGARNGGVPTWVDTAGDLWLFGGAGPYAMNDLWRYHIATNEWTWMAGPNVSQDPGNYGTIQVPSPSNNPPCRSATNAAWTDANNCLWFFGGSNQGYYSDMWKFDISTNQWTWMKGPNTTNQPAVYGTIGVPDVANIPNGRTCHGKWKDSNGNFWLFGGNSNNTINSYNDLWKYNPTTNEWAWMSGTNVANNTGTVGTPCVSCTSNISSARSDNSSCWTRAGDNFVNFGGIRTGGFYNDLWGYNVSTNQWTWMSGSIVGNQAGLYGTLLVSSPSNMPSSRMGSLSWSDSLGNLWMFGGKGNAGTLNDMWRFVPDTTCQIPGTPVTVHSAFTVNPITGCSPITVTFNNTSTNGNFYTWSIGNVTFSNSTNPTHTFSAGTYTVTLIANASCSADTSTMVITVEPIPQPVISGNMLCDTMPTVLDAGTYTWYHWSTGETTETITVNSANVYRVTVTNGNGCTGTAFDSVRVLQVPNPIIAGGDSFCVGHPVMLNTSNYSHYIWSTGSTTNQIVANSTGIYSVTVTDANGCAGIANDTVQVFNDNPIITGHSFCAGDTTTTLTTHLFAHYIWNTGSTTQSIIVLTANIYSVTVTDVNGCTGVDSINITTNPSPTQPIIIQQGDTLIITNFTTGIYWYNDGHYLSTYPFYIVKHTGCYQAIAIDSNGCKSKSDSICFSFAGINEITSNHGISIYPNPNDGTFTIHSPFSIPNSQLTIRDVIGQLIYSQSFINSKGMETITIPLSNGLYLWELTTNDGTLGKGKLAVIK